MFISFKLISLENIDMFIMISSSKLGALKHLVTVIKTCIDQDIETGVLRSSLNIPDDVRQDLQKGKTNDLAFLKKNNKYVLGMY